MDDLYYLKRIDSLGRIVIPKEYRDKLNTNPGDHFNISIKDNKIILEKYAPSCTFCNSTKNIINYKGKNICQKCKNEICDLF